MSGCYNGKIRCFYSLTSSRCAVVIQACEFSIVFSQVVFPEQAWGKSMSRVAIAIIGSLIKAGAVRQVSEKRGLSDRHLSI
jgi:hypothetical protein